MAATEQQINEGWRQHILEADMTPEVRLHILNELVDLVTEELAECDEEDKGAFKSELEKYKKLRDKAKEEFDA